MSREVRVRLKAELRRTNKDVVMKWFARGRLWETPEEAHAAGRMAKPAGEKRGGDWRPGGQHKDPRDRFKKKNRPERAWPQQDRQKPAGVAQVFRPANKPAQTVKKPEPPERG